jgi:hypothetical protein
VLGFWLKRGAIFSLAGIGLGWSDAEGSLLDSRLACYGPPEHVGVCVSQFLVGMCFRHVPEKLRRRSSKLPKVSLHNGSLLQARA